MGELIYPKYADYQPSSIQETSGGDIIYSSFRLQRNGLTPIGNPTFEEWTKCGEFIRKAEGAVHFWIGDWLNYGEKTYGETYAQAIDETGYDYGTLANDKFIASKIEFSRRRENVSFGHYQELAPLEPEEQDKFIAEIEKEKMPRAKLRIKIKEYKRNKELLKDNNDELPSGIELYNQDFRTSDLKENSVDLILTDPPYPSEFLPLWSDLSLFASKILKPSGFLIAYSGELNMPEVIKRLSENMTYYWTFCLYHEGKTQLVMPRNVICRWKPIFIFQKPPFKKLDITLQDYIVSEQREKEGHDWQQSESGASKLIEAFTQEGETICDPFAGYGTFLKAANDLKRKSIGYEIDKNTFELAKARL
jgi:hypothetical protein